MKFAESGCLGTLLARIIYARDLPMCIQHREYSNIVYTGVICGLGQDRNAGKTDAVTEVLGSRSSPGGSW